MEHIGFLSSVLLVLCGIPDLYRGIFQKRVLCPWDLLIIWFLGELFGLAYVLYIGDKPLLLNYGLNTAITGTLLYMKRKYAKTNSED